MGELTLVERRHRLVEGLYQLGKDLSSDQRHQVAHARKTLAQLRRVAVADRYEHGAYELVFRHDPPEKEQRVWLMVAGLYALNPRPHPGKSRLPLCAALGKLAKVNDGKYASSAQRRMQQLLTADTDRLSQDVRASLQMLDAHELPVNFHHLLRDLLVLLNADDERASDVRMRWARQFHRPDRESNTTYDTNETSVAEQLQESAT
ncbi:type I-E CRISPR-associated protein Cse2/CasB [Actinobacteria bacterium YIM 96077]|uniref:Type I-E CRISPR-associated protein Cse2/CasB n=1 Tax=Phytoactinopolyspora halophila TaxID=1981511 RepID=A0A329QGM1_9ACTN|nr:type I-E CRISPR-associated protein Cse2/CasB [Phytoactinopolyspora halophila]AYY13727.1 type I-E CRISPR-associated protein Cse2/CasB [Actinobacteria bacterium YIM 96077]RAW09458.1 type I-E CRISPR-associated protein Cse2/CasB [Phytoactinopolyspora halophila]